MHTVIPQVLLRAYSPLILLSVVYSSLACRLKRQSVPATKAIVLAVVETVTQKALVVTGLTQLSHIILTVKL